MVSRRAGRQRIQPEVRSGFQEPIGARYRDLEVLEAPPNSTGATFLQELNMAEQFDLRGMVPAGALPC